jgi:tRNA (mo5U34)-methyltransferase
MTPDSGGLRAAVERLSWYHRMELPGGVVTPGVSEAARGLRRLRLPERLDGLSVLDIGAWDGFYSFEAKRRGAARVVATDSYSWSGEGWGTKEGFLLARAALGVDVEDVDVDVMDLSAAGIGRFDLVLLLGVLYHLRDPITALERAAEVTAGRLIIETETSLTWYRSPAAAVYPRRELNDDDTNWWALNPAALRGLLRRAGFGRVETVWRTSLPRRAARAAVLRVRTGQPARQQFRSQRIVVHAWKGGGHPGPGGGLPRPRRSEL